MSDKIREIPTKADEMKAALEGIKRAAPSIIEMAHIMAQIRRAHYLAYLEQGFSEKQALKLCKKTTL